jgi:hypothetical protein
MTSTQPTATGPVVFEVLWSCPFCARNALVCVDLHPRTFAAIKAHKRPAGACAHPQCQQFIPQDIEQGTIDQLVSEPAGGSA